MRNAAQKRIDLRQPQDSPVTKPAVRPVNAIEKAERELLEIILTCPETIDLIRHHVGPDDIENTRHQRLLALCIDLWKEEGELPEPGRLMIAADSDSELLSLINAVLDSAEEKGIFRLMSEGKSTDGAATSFPPHLERVLAPLLEKREKQAGQLSRQLLASTDKSANELNDETRNALRRLQQFRQSQMGNPSSFK
jgi:hypothetical protein